MTRSEAYNRGWHTGRLWAEADARDGIRVDPEYSPSGHGIDRAHALGITRGYRDTWARIEAGTLTPSMYELAPLRGEASC